jgi:hypothetical protein
MYAENFLRLCARGHIKRSKTLTQTLRHILTISAGNGKKMSITRFDELFQERFMSGKTDEREMLEAMSDCVKRGLHYGVRGYYRRLAQTMIDSGYLDERGNIL